MIIFDIPQTRHKLNKFAAEQWDKTLAYLQGAFSLPRTDCEDIFQEAFLTLYDKITCGELTLTSSLSTYFIGICRNKAHERLRAMGKTKFKELPFSDKDEFEDEKIERLVALDYDSEQTEARKEAMVREIVADLPEPCDKILWGFYRDHLSMKTLAKIYNYKSEGSMKVTKYRCGEKFKKRFMELVHHLFD